MLPLIWEMLQYLSAYSQLDPAQDAFHYFWMTDSCPETCLAVEGKKPFEIITLAGAIAATLQI